MNALVVLGLCVFGLYAFPLAMFGPGLRYLPGDLGDSRFNNYILEHFHQYITGNISDYWDAPFMYPFKNVIALSDNLLGTAPLYSGFRLLGASREGAYQAWIVALFAANYACCWVALWKWCRHAILAACGAYIFAFGIYNIGHLDHLQMLPKFMVPLAFLWCWQYARTKRTLYLSLAVAAWVYQFYCGMYLGLMLLYGLFFFFIAIAIIVRDGTLITQYKDLRVLAAHVGVLGAGICLLIPLLAPYMRVMDEIPPRRLVEMIYSIPHVSSYFFTHPAALSWRSLSEHSLDAFPEWWVHYHFVGGLPWMAILVSPILLLRSRADREDKRRLVVALLALGACLLFCLNVDGMTLYHLIFALPGFSSMRAVDRIMNIEIVLFVLVFLFVVHWLLRLNRHLWPLTLLLPVLVVLDNRVDVGPLKRYDKFIARELVDSVVYDIRLKYEPSYAAIAYQPVFPFEGADATQTRRLEKNISAMLAAQELHIASANGYSGSEPGNFGQLFARMDQRALEDWCVYNHADPARIQPINNMPLDPLRIDTVAIKTHDGYYVCADPTRKGWAMADRPVPKAWETFVRISFEGGRDALLASNGQFLCAELLQGGEISATARRLGDFGIFRVEQRPDGSVAFWCDNDRAMTVDPVTRSLHAAADSIGPTELFWLEEVPSIP